MTNVVKFKPGATKPRPAAPEACQLLFFTGVRYVRMLDAPEPAPRKPRLRRRRRA